MKLFAWFSLSAIAKVSGNRCADDIVARTDNPNMEWQSCVTIGSNLRADAHVWRVCVGIMTYSAHADSSFKSVWPANGNVACHSGGLLSGPYMWHHKDCHCRPLKCKDDSTPFIQGSDILCRRWRQCSEPALGKATCTQGEFIDTSKQCQKDDDQHCKKECCIKDDCPAIALEQSKQIPLNVIVDMMFGFDIFLGTRMASRPMFAKMNELAQSQTAGEWKFPTCEGTNKQSCPWEFKAASQFKMSESTQVFKTHSEFYSQVTESNGASIHGSIGVNAGIGFPGFTVGFNTRVSRTMRKSSTSRLFSKSVKSQTNMFAWGKMEAVVAEVATVNYEAALSDDVKALIKAAVTKDQWLDLYRKYGTHLITKAHLGGLVETMTVSSSSKQEKSFETEFTACAQRSTCASAGIGISASMKGLPVSVGVDVQGCSSSAQCKSANSGGSHSSSNSGHQTFTEISGGNAVLLTCGDPSQRVRRYLNSFDAENLHLWPTSMVWLGEMADGNKAREAAADALATVGADHAIVQAIVEPPVQATVEPPSSGSQDKMPVSGTSGTSLSLLGLTGLVFGSVW